MTTLPTGLPVATPPAAPAAPTVHIGWRRVLTDPKFIGACFAFIFLMGSAFIMGAGASPADKLQFFKTAVYGAAAIYAAALGALGYETGKLFEGVIPAGFVPSNMAVMQAMPIERIVSETGLPGEGIQLGPQGAEPIRRDIAPTIKGSHLPLWLWLVLSAALIALGGGGCASTSDQFRLSIGGGVNNVVQDMRDYVAHGDFDANHDGTTDAAEAAVKADQTQKTDALAASVADQKTIKTAIVKSAWEAVKPIWVGYVNADPSLADPKQRKTILNTGDGIDALIKVEEERENLIKNLLAGLGIGS